MGFPDCTRFIMQRVIILHRKSNYHPDPVLCGVFLYELGGQGDAENRIVKWKQNFLYNFPEFNSMEADTVFEQTYTDIL